MTNSNVNTAETMPNTSEQKEQEVKRSKDMKEAQDLFGGISVELRIANNPNVGARFANSSDIENLFRPVLKKIEADEKEKADEISGSSEDPESRGEQAGQIMEETNQSLDFNRERIRAELLKLIGGLELLAGGENKSLLKLKPEAVNLLDWKAAETMTADINTQTDNMSDVPVGNECYALSPSKLESLTDMLDNAPQSAACRIVKQFEGGIVTKFGEKSVAFLSSGNVEVKNNKFENEQDDKEDEDKKDSVVSLADHRKKKEEEFKEEAEQAQAA